MYSLLEEERMGVDIMPGNVVILGMFQFGAAVIRATIHRAFLRLERTQLD